MENWRIKAKEESWTTKILLGIAGLAAAAGTVYLATEKKSDNPWDSNGPYDDKWVDSVLARDKPNNYYNPDNKYLGLGPFNDRRD